MVEINDIEFNLLKGYLSRICGIEVPSEKRYLFKTRLSDFLAQEGCESFSALYARLAASSDKMLQRRLVQAMTTHESSFFRDWHPFDVLTRKLLPTIMSRRVSEAKTGRPRIRILSCGCSSGQEPYSIAMCVREWACRQDGFTEKDVSILGIDISRRILAKAEAGVYADMEMGRYMPDRFRGRYFTQKHGMWHLSEDIRRQVRFAELNLAEDFAFLGRFDIIFCRNVIIYFSAELRREVTKQFCRMLNPGGALVLGASESLYQLSDQFEAAHDGPTTYYVPVTPCDNGRDA